MCNLKKVYIMPGVEGRVTMVTGAGRGIGRVAANLLASRGARVMAGLCLQVRRPDR